MNDPRCPWKEEFQRLPHQEDRRREKENVGVRGTSFPTGKSINKWFSSRTHASSYHSVLQSSIRVCVYIKRQPCWCKTRTRGDSSSVAAHSFLLLRKTQDIPLSISALFFLFFHLQTPSRTRALCPNCLRWPTRKQRTTYTSGSFKPGTFFTFQPLLPEGENQTWRCFLFV